ncbi:MAG: hypothetical protein BGO64_14255 [Aeromonas sp. 62-46]|uniref:head-tail joining protein n=1 Tax=Aeromonas sp. 62-46 TaxID=1895698 RepID=UPI000928EB04|nr:hypothetical protein [Aeromonas sp. 62-46]OJW67502.1 MAG: hypothetical protein BGO64_14255 [Aeromonas sp. 62-46]
MLKSGELDTRLTRFGAATGTPPEWPLLGKLWAKIIDPKAAGREAQGSIYATGSTLITVRARGDILPGQLLKGNACWYLIEDTAIEPGALQISARKLSGEPATYTPKQGEPYPVTAFLAAENVMVGARSEPRHQIDLILPELVPPFARQGDQITLRGRQYRIDGLIEGSDNGTTLRVMVV